MDDLHARLVATVCQAYCPVQARLFKMGALLAASPCLYAHGITDNETPRWAASSSAFSLL